MSTLTKILIVLLTISSIFLCGIVVTYVGSATNYKEQFISRKSDIDSLKVKNDNLTKQINDTMGNRDQEVAKLNSTIELLRNEITSKDNELIAVKRERDVAQQRRNNYEAIIADNMETIELNNKLRVDAEAKVTQLIEQQTSDQGRIQEMEEGLMAKNATIDLLESEKKQLAEEKTQLQNQLDNYLRQVGKAAGTPVTVTSVADKAKIAPAVRDISVEGQINEVNLQDSLASISVGSADGVKENMRFHVTRGQKFICDIVISQVDTDIASGYFELIGEDRPRTGDIVKTNF